MDNIFNMLLSTKIDQKFLRKSSTRVRDIVTDLPIFENTTDRLEKAKRRGKSQNWIFFVIFLSITVYIHVQ